MSLILAFGLSPLGQVPAYATEGESAVATQEVSPVETQAAAVFASTYYTTYDTTAKTCGADLDPTLTYSGGVQYIALHVTESEKGNEVQNTGVDSVNASKPGDVDPAKLLYTVKLTGPDGKEISEVKSGWDQKSDALFQEQSNITVGTTSDKQFVYYAAVTDAGTYTATITPTTGTYKSSKAQTLTFTVSKFDLEKLKEIDAYATGEKAPKAGEVALVDAAGKVIDRDEGISYTGSSQLVTAVVGGMKSTEVTVSDASATNVGGFDVVIDAYSGDSNKNVEGSKTVSSSVEKNYFLATSSSEAYKHTRTAPITGGTTEYAKVNKTESNKAGYAITVGADEYKGSVGAAPAVGDYDLTKKQWKTAATVTVDGTTVTGWSNAVVQVPVEEMSDPIKLTYGDQKLVSPGDYRVKSYEVASYKAATETEVAAVEWTDTELSKIPTTPNTVFRANIVVTDNANFINQGAGTEVTVYAQVNGGTSKISSIADRAVVSDTTYMAEALDADADGITASFYKDDALVSTVGKHWGVAGTYQVAAGSTATTAVLDTKTAKNVEPYFTGSGKPLGAGDYTVRLTGDGEYFDNATGTADTVEATFKVLPRAATPGEGVGNLKITLGDQPFNNGDFVDMNLGTASSVGNYKVQLVTNTDGDVADIPETYVGFLGNEVRNWKVTWLNSKGEKVIAPADMGDYKAVFEFSGSMEGTPTQTIDFKVEAGDIANFVDGISDDKGKVDTAATYEKVASPAGNPSTSSYYELVDGAYVASKDTAVVAQKDYYNETSAKVINGLDYVKNPSLTYTGVGQKVNGNSLTLVKKWTAADDATHKKGNYYAVGNEITDNCTYELTYEPNNATARLDENGLPLTKGTYIMTATFSGSYTGTITGMVAVNELDLTDVVKGTKGAIMQYQLEDGRWTSNYSAAYTGSDIVPEYRIVTTTSATTAKPVEIDKSAYTATFKDNKAAGSDVKVTVTAGQGQGANVIASKAEQSPAFTIAQKAFADEGVGVEISKDSAELKKGGTADDFTVQVKKGNDALSYYDVNKDNQVTGTYEDNAKAYPQVYYKDATDKWCWTATDSVDGTSVTAGDAVSDQTKVKANPGRYFSLRAIDENGKEVSGVKFEVANLADPTTVTVKNFPLSDAGTYYIVAEAAPNATNPEYAGRVEAKFTVNGLDISNANLFGVTYTPAKDTNKGTKAGETLPFGVDWDVDYDAVQAKSKSGIVLGTNTSTSTPTTNGYLRVGPASANLTKDSSALLKLSTDGRTGDYKLTYEKNREAGTAKVIIEGINDYTGTVEHDVIINRAKLANVTYADDGEPATGAIRSGVGIVYDDKVVQYDKATKTFRTPYTGEKINPSCEVIIYENGKPKSYLDASEYESQWWNDTNVSYQNNSPTVDTAATIYLSLTKNYEGNLRHDFAIDPIDLTPQNTTVTAADLPYTGKAQKPAVTVKYGNLTLTEGVDYTVPEADNSAEGDYTATVLDAFLGNYTISGGSLTAQYKVKPADQITYDLKDAKVELDKASFTYNGQVQGPKVTKVTTAAGVEVPADLYKATVDSATNAGKYSVKVEGAAANVTNTATAEFAIDKANNSLKIAKATRVFKGVSKKKVTKAGVKVKKASQTKVTYKKVSVKKGKKAAAKKAAKKILVNKTTGKITVKKGLKAGKYLVTVSAKAAESQNYNASAVQKAVVTLKVKK